MARAWMPRQYRWEIAPPLENIDELAGRLRLTPLLAQVLHNRGLTTAEAIASFLNPKLTDLADPALLEGVVPAARRIARAVANHERIVIYGDYDVDGITAVAILHACLSLAAADVHFYVPHRLDEGYGVNADAVRKIAADGTKLMITVDCGISASGPLAEAAEAGMDVIVTDHHAVPAVLPKACAIVHPAISGEGTPFRDLCGAGVAFKLAWQVAREICGTSRVDDRMKDFLVSATSLAALGTIADVVSLTGENRILATFGLRTLPQSRHPGLRALLDSSGLTDQTLDAYHVGFMLAPRINACGRLGHAQLAVELLTIAPEKRCLEIAAYLAQQNVERQRVEREIAEQAVALAVAGGAEDPSTRALVLADEAWHGGVIGIVASRIVERFGRPAFLIAINGDGCGHGSCRSIAGFNIAEALAACGEHLLSYGGHAMAGGMRIKREKIDDFRKAMIAYAAAKIPAEQLLPALNIDAETTLAALNQNVVEHLGRMAPFGQGNPSPVVAVRGCDLMTLPKRMGRTGQAVSMMLRQNGTTMRAVGFGMGDLADALAAVNKIDIVGEPNINKFNGRTSVEIKLRDVDWQK